MFLCAKLFRQKKYKQAWICLDSLNVQYYCSGRADVDKSFRNKIVLRVLQGSSLQTIAFTLLRTTLFTDNIQTPLNNSNTSQKYPETVKSIATKNFKMLQNFLIYGNFNQEWKRAWISYLRNHREVLLKNPLCNKFFTNAKIF